MATKPWTKHIKQHVYYESSMFPDIKFMTLKQARMAELGELLKNQMSHDSLPLDANVNRILEEMSLIQSDAHEPVWHMAEEFIKFKNSLEKK